MEFWMNDERELVRESIREFVATEVEPLARKIDEEDYFPAELFPKLGELGFLDLYVPEEYGGSNLDLISHAIICEEISKVSPTLGMCLIAHSALAMTMINKMPDGEEKSKWLPELVSGKAIGCVATTEPCGNGNPGGFATFVTEDGDDYVINGQKSMATNIGVSKYYMVEAADPAGEHTFYVVEAGTPGFTVGKAENKVGWRGSHTGTLYFENVRIPKSHKLPNTFLDASYFEMVGSGAVALGIAETAWDKAWTYAMNRKTAEGVPFPVQYQVMANRFMEALGKIDCIRYLTYAEALGFVSGAPDPVHSTLVKPNAFKLAEEVASVCIDMCGGVGLSIDTGVERMWREAKCGMIGGGQYDLLLDIAFKTLLMLSGQ